jgi:hypothetical protein
MLMESGHSLGVKGHIEAGLPPLHGGLPHLASVITVIVTADASFSDFGCVATRSTKSGCWSDVTHQGKLRISPPCITHELHLGACYIGIVRLWRLFR